MRKTFHFILITFSLLFCAPRGEEDVKEVLDIIGDKPVLDHLEVETSITSPEIEFLEPSAKSVIQDVVKVKVKVKDPSKKGIQKVEFGIGTKYFGNKTKPDKGEIFSFDINTKEYTEEFGDGKTEIRVKATSKSGAVGSATLPVIIDNNPPLINVISPKGQNIIGDIILKFTVNDKGGVGVSKIEVFVNEEIFWEAKEVKENYEYNIPIKKQGEVTIAILVVDKLDKKTEWKNVFYQILAPSFQKGKSVALHPSYIYHNISGGAITSEFDGVIIFSNSGTFHFSWDKESLKYKPLKITDKILNFFTLIDIDNNDTNEIMGVVVEGGKTSAGLFQYSKTSGFTLHSNIAPQTFVAKGVKAGKINADEYADIVMSIISDKITLGIFLNDQGKGFKEPYYITGIPFPTDFDIGDFDNDGQNDIVVIEKTSGKVFTFLNSGDGNFFAPLQSKDTVNKPDQIIAGAFYGDEPGKEILDLAVLSSDNSTINILEGKKNGEFLFETSFFAGKHPLFFSAEDIDENGVKDFIALSKESNITSIYMGTKIKNEGEVYSIGEWYNANQNNPSSIAIADMNGDKKKDIVILNDAIKEITILVNQGKGVFEGTPELLINAQPYGIAVGNFNKDKYKDIVALARGKENEDVLLTYISGGKKPTHASIISSSVGIQTPYNIASADLKNDGILDIVVGSEIKTSEKDIDTPTMAVLEGNGDGSFSTPNLFAAGISPKVFIVDKFDNQDNFFDIIVINYIGKGKDGVSIFTGDESGKNFSTIYANPEEGFTPVPIGDEPVGIAIGNFNKDSFKDVVIANSKSDNVTYLRGMGKVFFTKESKTLSVGKEPVDIKVGLIDGKKDDKWLDIVVALKNDIAILYGVDKEEFSPPEYLGYSGGEISSLQLIDFNKDGYIDIAITDKKNNTLSVFMNLGKRQFSKPFKFNVGLSPLRLLYDDFDNDGCEDLLTMNETSQTITLLLRMDCEKK